MRTLNLVLSSPALGHSSSSPSAAASPLSPANDHLVPGAQEGVLQGREELRDQRPRRLLLSPHSSPAHPLSAAHGLQMGWQLKAQKKAEPTLTCHLPLGTQAGRGKGIRWFWG